MNCYNCGGQVIVAEGSRIGVCSCCMAEIPLPKEGSSIAEAYSQANILLSESRFDEAREAFREILIQAPMEAAACWGMAVSEYGIEFVQDPGTGEMKPTLHRLSRERFSEYLYVQQAIQYAPDLMTRMFYAEQSQKIDQIQSESLDISAKEDPYDVFICYKKTEEGEKRTADSRMAADLYRELVSRGYKVFFAEETLRVGEEYEPRIFAALHSAKVLLAIASKREYYDAAWVRNEWSRYVDLIRTEKEQGKTGRLLIPVYQNMSSDQLPEDLRQMPHHVDMSNLANPRQELLSLVANHFDRGKKEDVSNIRRSVRSSIGGGIGGRTNRVRMTASAENYITRATIQLVGGNFEDAKEIFFKALEMEPSYEGYLGVLMCDLNIAGKESLFRYDQSILEHPMYRKALMAASPKEKEELEKIVVAIEENGKWERVCEEKKDQCKDVIAKIAVAVDKGKLGSPAFTQYQNMLKWTEEKGCIGKHVKKDKDNDFKRYLSRFIIFCNLIPSIFVWLQDVVERSVDNGIYIGIAGVAALMIIYGYMYCLPRMIASKGILDSGCITGLIRVGIGYGLLMAVIMLSDKSRFGYVLASVGAAVLYYLIAGKRARRDRRELAQASKEAKVKLNQVYVMADTMKEEAKSMVEKKIEEFHQYFRKESEWNDLQIRYEANIDKKIDQLIKKLEDQLRELA